MLVGLFYTDEERPNGRIREVLPFVFSADTNEHDDLGLFYTFTSSSSEKKDDLIVMLESIGSDK